ncbi:MAG: hypothetical protein KDK45_15590, partial [Leptospiraceae bacterium]|nr:hypothetical protein [Leptospiraceae bacterium]
GGTVSTGSEAGKKLFQPGLNLSLNNRRSKGIDSVMKRFIQKDVPVIHLTQIKVLAAKYGLPISPKETPRIGEGKIYYKEEYNTYLALSIFLGIILLLYIFFKTELGVYIFYNTKYNTSKKSDLEPTI